MSNHTDYLTTTESLAAVPLEDLLATCPVVFSIEVPGKGTVNRNAPEMVADAVWVRFRTSGINPHMTDSYTANMVQEVVMRAAKSVEEFLGRELDRVEAHAAHRLAAEVPAS